MEASHKAAPTRSKVAPQLPLTIDAETGRPITTPGGGPKDKRIRLNTLEDVQREIGRVYREMRTGKLPHESGTKLVYVLKVLAEVDMIRSLKQRVAALEGRLANGEPLLLGDEGSGE